MATHQVKLSMNGLRRNLTNDASELREEIEQCLELLPDNYKEDLIEKFDQLACGINSLNCVSIEGDDSFTDMNEVEVKLIGDYD